jgi:hypothetical protein
MLRKTVMPIIACIALPALADESQLLDEARKVATSLPPKLITRLQEEMAKSGADGAIPVCKDMAPQLAKELSAQSGWKIKRVTLKTRNEQRATPDAWEKEALEDFDRRVAAGEKPAQLEKGAIVEDNGMRVYRYVKALPVQPLCLACHGTQEQIAPAVKARLAEQYPHDKATGYGEGQIRGAISVSKPL